jgi:hypothetical protein
MTPPALRFTLDEAQAAADAWGFNCGPGALAAVLGLTPDELRPSMGSFEQKGYTNPLLMAEILKRLNVPFRRVFESAVDPGARVVVWPRFGLVRVQWSGPWTKPGVPMAARYRHTHWIGVCEIGFLRNRLAFDINAIGISGAFGPGWMLWSQWTGGLVPWLLKECQPKADGRWWPTHCWEIQGAVQ